jgi:hypothetical protein
MRHPLDPVAAHDAASLFGRLEAQSLLDEAESDRVLIARAERAQGVDRAGLRSRLFASRAAARTHWAAERRRADWRIRSAIAAPLAARAPRADILHAATTADPAGALLAHEREAIVLGALRRLLRTART